MKTYPRAGIAGAVVLAMLSMAAWNAMAGSIVRVSAFAGVHAQEIQSGVAEYVSDSGEGYASATATAVGTGTVQVISTLAITNRGGDTLALTFDCQRIVSVNARPSTVFNPAGYTNAFMITVSADKDFTLTTTWEATCSGYVFGMPYLDLYDGSTWLGRLFDSWDDKPHPSGALTNQLAGRSGERTLSIPITGNSFASVPASSQQNDRVTGTITLHFDFPPKTDQTISFSSIPDQVMTGQVALSASASSGLPVSFAVHAGPGVITGGSHLAFTATGRVSVVASQAGDANWNPAPRVTNSLNVTAAAAPATPLAADFDGDRKADPALYVEATGTWCLKLSASGYALVTLPFGGVGYEAVARDFDGDGLADPATFQAASGAWQIKLSGSGYAEAGLDGFGGANDLAVAGDYDGDGLADPAIYHTADGTWRVAMSSAGYGVQEVSGFGGAGYTAVAQNYDSDHRYDAAIYNTANGNWTILLSAANYNRGNLWGFGGTGFDPVLGDFDGDGLADPAIYAEATGTWQVKTSASGYATATLAGFGGTGYAVGAADYDGDGKADPALLDLATGAWRIKLSGSGYAEAGLASGWTP